MDITDASSAGGGIFMEDLTDCVEIFTKRLFGVHQCGQVLVFRQRPRRAACLKLPFGLATSFVFSSVFPTCDAVT